MMKALHLVFHRQVAPETQPLTSRPPLGRYNPGRASWGAQHAHTGARNNICANRACALTHANVQHAQVRSPSRPVLLANSGRPSAHIPRGALAHGARSCRNQSSLMTICIRTVKLELKAGDLGARCPATPKWHRRPAFGAIMGASRTKMPTLSGAVWLALVAGAAQVRGCHHAYAIGTRLPTAAPLLAYRPRKNTPGSVLALAVVTVASRTRSTHGTKLGSLRRAFANFTLLS